MKSFWFWGSLKRLLLVASVFLFSVQQVEAFNNYKELPKSQADRYRIQSQFGTKEAVLNPLFPKRKRFEYGGAISYSPVSSLMEYWGFSLHGVYHFNQRHAFEPLWVQYNRSKLSSFTETEIRDKLNNGADRERLGIDLPEFVYAASYQFSPFYSKIRISQNSVLHMDTYLGLGVAGIKTRQTNLLDEQEKGEWRVGASLSLGLRFFMQDRFAFRFELRDLIYNSKNIESNSILNTLQMTGGLSFFWSSFPDFSGV